MEDLATENMQLRQQQLMLIMKMIQAEQNIQAANIFSMRCHTELRELKASIPNMLREAAAKDREAIVKLKQDAGQIINLLDEKTRKYLQAGVQHGTI